MAKKDKAKTSKHIKCEIRYDSNPLAVYRPGDTVNGNVELTLGKNKKFRGVCLRINGFASTYWDAKVKNGSTNNKKRKTSFKGREDYFNTISYLVGSDVGNPLEVVAGSYSYPFSCVIPTNAPASMEGKCGHIRYLVQLTLERPWKHDIVYLAPFTVRGESDLNLLSGTLSLPSKAEIVTSFYFGLSDPLVVTATTPRSGYAPGEAIELVIHVNNQSSVDVKTIMIKLQRVVTFVSQVPWTEHFVENTVLEERNTGKIGRRHNARFEENILIGGGVPTNDSLCRIIFTKYEIEIVVHPVRSRKRPTIRLPIVLGTVGLASSNVYPDLVIQKQREAFAEYAPSAPPATTSDQMENSPPAYYELQQNVAGTSQVYSISSNMTLDEAAEDESEKGSEPYTPRDY
ncbi:arrestin domain-containing protein 17-like isoform X1 [Topomyia yanbarensis]|uniref:arrestin domain-containing protein 17-like isoform X1 n=1 Tax=Topomyia yanbarensis TaxID=2498891 RepID=UPI00273B1DDC|nr:arrestin domain-containing protein 17-like isoform X1 [Topomyia yanbarensis]